MCNNSLSTHFHLLTLYWWRQDKAHSAEFQPEFNLFNSVQMTVQSWALTQAWEIGNTCKNICDYVRITHMKNYSSASLSIRKMTAYGAPFFPISDMNCFVNIVWPLTKLTAYRDSLLIHAPIKWLKNFWMRGMYLTIELRWHEGSLCNKE